MTRVEADAWASDSVYQRTVYHVTTAESAVEIRRRGFDLGRRAGGRVWGNGVYAAVDQDTLGRYLQQLGTRGTALELRVGLRSVLSVRVSPLPRRSPLEQVLARLPDGIARLIDASLTSPNRPTARHACSLSWGMMGWRFSRTASRWRSAGTRSWFSTHDGWWLSMTTPNVPVVPERQTAEDYELAAQLQETLARWAPSELSDCQMCRHLATNGGMTCAAFPDGIPWEITSGEFDHRQPHPRDHGVRYDPIQPEEFQARAATLRAEGRAVAERTDKGLAATG